MGSNAVVAVVGGGASGCLTASHVARTARAAGRNVDILLVEPNVPGQGLAYSTADPRHRLNVPAKGMSALPDEPGHFLAWMRRHVHVDFPEGGFAPRLHFADYLADVLDESLGESVRLETVRARVSDLRRHGRRLRLTFDDGTSRPVDAVVLAMGHGEPSVAWAPEAMQRSHRFIADPWRANAAPTVRAGDDVLLVGAGLTMADMAQGWGRRGVRLHVVSRHGMLPLAHATDPQPPLPAPELPDSDHLTAAQVRRLVFAQVRAAGGDWRRAIDGLRPVTSRLWRAMDADARADFLRTAARRWDRVRHRIDPSLARWLDERTADGSMVVHAGGVVSASEDAKGLHVELADGTRITPAAVLNCTGTTVGLRSSHDPLVLNLLDSGTAVPGSLDLGFATDDDGRVISSTGSCQPAIWTVGPLRRGELWESTAIPEIRSQAAEVAASVVAALPSPTLRRRPRDLYGLPLSASAPAAALYDDALGRILRVQSGAPELVARAVAADPDFALGHAVQALLGVEWGADVDVRAALENATRASAHADERERRFVEVAIERVQSPGAGSAAALLAYLQTYPEDALAVSIAVPTIAFGGATEIPAEAWALVEGLEPAYGGDWWYPGLLGFIRQEQDRFDEARELADRSLAIEPAAGHAVHARAHAHYETGDHVAGLAWLDRWISTCGARASHRAHFSWHAALHELALGHDRAALARYAGQLAPPSVTGVRALVDSASLLWRGYASGAWGSVDVGPVLATVPPALLADPPTPFVGLHAAVALAAAGDAQGLARLRRRAASRPDAVFAGTVAPLADALVHLVLGDADRATDALLALEGVERLGGSAAQREIVEDTLIHCAARAGRTDLARSLLHDRLERRHSPRDARRSAALVAGRPD
ncbi:FAD/NAD(P)-binding protein [Jatrophihabitans endophyticus]|uniref:FAD/NAD(P)-binding protein n=1 Tax=Jatrophihabitans endophyticus TaxID=1206085 RepID=UPI0019EEEA2E|nr:FAD/NAD(P)-binding protein [Jatrophihabitans endophyticus]MBE7189065.1 FAD/NAD(P)-binding protein [Jatrophihabitans endophyticus]